MEGNASAAKSAERTSPERPAGGGAHPRDFHEMTHFSPTPVNNDGSNNRRANG